MADAAIWTFRGRPLGSEQLYELSAAWRPVGGVILPALKGWATAAGLDESRTPRSDEEWQDLAMLLDHWVRSPEGRAYGARPQGPALWEEHLAGFEEINPEATGHRAVAAAARLPEGAPPLAQSLAALSDLHPWIAWMKTTNRVHRTDVVPRLCVRELGIFAHTQCHGSAWSWDARLRDAGVDPLGDPDEQAPRALAVLRDSISWARQTGYGGQA